MGAEKNAQVRHHFGYAGAAPSASDMQAIASSIRQAWQAGPLLSQGSFCTLTQVKVIDLSKPDSPVGINAGSFPGTAGGGQLPASTCVLITFSVARRYRGGKPRTYLPIGTDSDLQTPTAWLPASVTNFDTHWTTYSGQVGQISWAGGNISGLVNVSYYSGGTWVPREPPTGRTVRVPTPRHPPLKESLTGHAVSSTPGSQRRRLHPSL
jgi:hypothetical protein